MLIYPADSKHDNTHLFQETFSDFIINLSIDIHQKNCVSNISSDSNSV